MSADQIAACLFLIVVSTVLSVFLLLDILKGCALLLEARANRRAGLMVPIPPQPSKLKLFLSWAALQRALRNCTVSEEDLDQCLFCTSVAELCLAKEYDRQWFEQLYPVFIKAAKENRLIWHNDSAHFNATPIWMLNMLLKRNGYALLSCADQSGTLGQIPTHACVPRVSDHALEVLWAAHPLQSYWRTCWRRCGGRSFGEIDAVFVSINEAAAEDFGRPDAWKKGRPQDED